MKETDLLIGKRVVGPGSKVFVVAEIGINHNGSISQAARMIDSAAEAGADAVKFQSYRVDRLLIPSRNRYAQQMGSMESAYEMLRRCELSWEDQEKLSLRSDHVDSVQKACMILQKLGNGLQQ